MAKPPSGSLWQGAACHEDLKVRLPSSANHPSLWSHRGMKPPVARPLTMPPISLTVPEKPRLMVLVKTQPFRWPLCTSSFASEGQD